MGKQTISSYLGTDTVPVLPASLADARIEAARASVSRFVILPGFCDVHVHFREPGFSYKETVASGCASAARGGYTQVLTMPNLSPVPDSRAHLDEVLLPTRGAPIDVRPYGAITVGQRGEELAELSAMASDVCAFSDDGRGVQDPALMRCAMTEAKRLGKLLVAHCEDNSLLRGGYIHDGDYAREHGHAGICSESEYGPIARDVELVREVGCAYHVCHISTKESVDILRRAKAAGLDVTCETGPHYLTLTDADLEEDGRFKMNPPLRSVADRDALIAGVLDGTVDMIATDHAPHSAEEKSRGLSGSSFGVVGLETAFPVMYTEFVKQGLLSMHDLIRLMATAPRERFDLPQDGYSVWDLEAAYEVDPDEFLSMGRATPFEGRQVYGRCLLTVAGGRVVYDAEHSEIKKSDI